MDSPRDLGADRLSGRGLAVLILMACTAPMAPCFAKIPFGRNSCGAQGIAMEFPPSGY